MAARRGTAIDIGSNTTLFLTGDADSAGVVRIINEAQFSNGIGNDVFNFGRISPETISKNAGIIRELNLRASAGGSEIVIAAGTSALRNAGNAAEFIQAVKNETGIEISVIPGEEEARLSYLGYLSSGVDPQKPLLLVDVGGGSSECVLAGRGKITECFSLNIGAVRLLREFDLGDPPHRAVYARMESHIPGLLSRVGELNFKDGDLVISGGTATALAAMNRNLISYAGDVVEGTRLDYHDVLAAQEKFLTLELSARKSLLSFDPDRAEVIIGGTAIILALLKLLSLDSFKVTHRGLRFGLLSEWGNSG